MESVVLVAERFDALVQGLDRRHGASELLLELLRRVTSRGRASNGTRGDEKHRSAYWLVGPEETHTHVFQHICGERKRTHCAQKEATTATVSVPLRVLREP